MPAAVQTPYPSQPSSCSRSAHARKLDQHQESIWAQDPTSGLQHLVLQGPLPEPTCLQGYNNILDACARAKNYAKAAYWFQHLTERGFQPNCVTYNCMVNAAARRGLIAEAVWWVEDMRKAGMNPCVLTYNCLMNACVVGGKHNDAAGWLDECKSAGLIPDRVSYSTMVHACWKAKDPKQASQWLQEMLDEGVKPGFDLLNKTIRSLAADNQVELAVQWLDVMWKEGYKPNAELYTKIISGCSRCRPPQPELAETMLLAMQLAQVRPTTQTRSAAISALGEQRLAKLEEELSMEFGKADGPDCNSDRGRVAIDRRTFLPVGGGPAGKRFVTDKMRDAERRSRADRSQRGLVEPMQIHVDSKRYQGYRGEDKEDEEFQSITSGSAGVSTECGSALSEAAGRQS